MSRVPIYSHLYMAASVRVIDKTEVHWCCGHLRAWQLSLSATFTCDQHVTWVNSGLFNPQLYQEESEAFALNRMGSAQSNSPQKTRASLNQGHPELKGGPLNPEMIQNNCIRALSAFILLTQQAASGL